MKFSGKISLFFSSYLPVWVVWVISQEFKLNVISISGIVLTILSILTVIVFKKTYETTTMENVTSIAIADVSSGTSEAISYLVTLIIPVATSTIPFSVFGGNFDQNVIITLTLSIAIFLIYLRSNLAVMNPTMMAFGYSLYILKYKPAIMSYEITFDAILITKKPIEPKEISSPINVTIVDQGVYLL
jgi:hypothetical protein